MLTSGRMVKDIGPFAALIGHLYVLGVVITLFAVPRLPGGFKVGDCHCEEINGKFTVDILYGLVGRGGSL